MTEIIDNQTYLALLILQARYEKQITDEYDPNLSRKLDALAVLLED
jgi:hypothetical protein